MKAIYLSTGQTVARTLSVAETFLTRGRGLLGRNGLPRGEGLLIRPCRGVHTFFMKFPIDVLFLDGANRVVATVKNLKPHRITRIIGRAKSVIELPPGTLDASGTRAGNRILIE